MAFTGIQQLVDEAYLGGKHWYSSFRLDPPARVGNSCVRDFSVYPAGVPYGNAYDGTDLTAYALDSSTGINHGGDVSPATKHLHKMSALIVSGQDMQTPLVLCDYLLYYPSVSMEVTDLQTMDNTVTLPRYTTGEGVRAFMVLTTAMLSSHGTSFVMNYTDSNNIANQTVVTCTTYFSYANAIVHSGIDGAATMHGMFMHTPGSIGIRSVQSIQFLGINHGMATLVLCRPIATVFSADTNTPSEWDFMIMKPMLPRIYDGACLNFLSTNSGSWQSNDTIIGEIHTIWN